MSEPISNIERRTETGDGLNHINLSVSHTVDHPLTDHQTNFQEFTEPREIPEDSNFHIVVYFFFQYGGNLIMRLLLGALLLELLFSDRPKLTPILALLASYQIWTISFNLFCLIYYGNKVTNFRKTYYFDIVLGLGYFLVFIGLFLYIEKAIKPERLPYFILPHIVLMFLRLAVGEAVNTPFLPLSAYCFFESIQILYITLKLTRPDSYGDWTLILIFYYVAVAIVLLLALVLTFAILIGSFLFVVKREWFASIDSVFILFIISGFFYLIWNGIVSYLLLAGFHQFIIDNGSLLVGVFTFNWYLHSAAVMLVTCSVITIGMLIGFFVYIRENWGRLFHTTKEKKITFFWLTRNLQLNFHKVSPNYFQPGKTFEEPKIEEKCNICFSNEGEVMLYPCGHSGMCKPCISDLIKENDKCPLCREPIDKVYFIYYDNKKKNYMTKGFIKIER